MQYIDCTKMLSSARIELFSHFQFDLGTYQIGKLLSAENAYGTFIEKEVNSGTDNASISNEEKMENRPAYVRVYVCPFHKKCQSDPIHKESRPEVDSGVDISEDIIHEKFKDSVRSVFIKEYTVDGTVYPSYPQIKKTALQCIDPNYAPSVAIFIEACIARECARIIARRQPTKVVDALIGLGICKFADQLCYNRFIDNVGRKFKRLDNSDMTYKEQQLFDEAFKMLGRPKGSSVLD